MRIVETKDEDLDCLKAEIEQTHKCPAHFIRTETVNVAIAGKSAWLGEVGVFGLIGHLEAKRCFAWGHGPDRVDPKGHS
jgi:hypothetical protein